MSAEEKAKELVMSFLNAPNRINRKEYLGQMLFIVAKQCALIAVDEILSLNGFLYPQNDWSNNNDYWQKVKEEIQKL